MNPEYVELAQDRLNILERGLKVVKFEDEEKKEFLLADIAYIRCSLKQAMKSTKYKLVENK